MGYRIPGVTVTQQFIASAPALAASALPCVAIGPAYQIVNNASLGNYSGAEQAYAYAGLVGGNIADVSELAADELFPATKKPISVTLKNVVIEVLASQSTGSGAGDVFSDATSGQFANVLAGDTLEITPVTGLTIVAAQTNGQSSDTAGQRNRLTAGTANQFANVKVGDVVAVTAGTNTVTGSFTVSIKVSANLLVLSADINDGVGPSTNVAFSVTGNRGQTNAASYKVKAKTNANTLVLNSPLSETPEAPLTYKIRRALVTPVTLARQPDLLTPGFFADEDAVTLPAALAYTFNSVDYPILSAAVEGSYRALRTDLASEIRSFADLAAVEAVFGVGQVVPANPLAFAIANMRQNTVTTVQGLGLSADFVTDEVLAYTRSLDVLALEPMYALAPQTHNPVVHSLFKNHVEQLSLPGAKLERVVLVQSLLDTVGLVKDEATTSTSLVGARNIVTTQVDGSGAVASPAILNDGTADAFLNVAIGDSVTIVSGTGVTPGVYLVTAKTSNNSITVGSSFITSGSPADIVYFIQRRDGLSPDGVTFYDRSATFLTDGAAAGHFLNILSGQFKGRWKIASITSERQLVLSEPILGVTTLLVGVDYSVDRDLSKDEQAENVKGYAEAIGSRRVVHMWPDILQAPAGQVIVDVPGYMAGNSIAALTSGLPPQQGFTNLSISGFLGLKHSTKYFTEAQLNTIASGGNMVLVQDNPGQPLLVRHQLTTDRSQIKFQEYSVTKNVDSIAKFLRSTYRGPIGKYNIVDTTLDLLKTTATAAIKFLRDSTALPFIGGQIRSGSLKSLQESTTQIDTVEIKFAFRIPIPLNYIDITIEV